MLLAAHKYNVSELISICLNYLENNLTQQNAVEVMTKSYLISKDLFHAARKFVQSCQNDGKTVEIEVLEELKTINPTLALEIVSHAFFYGQKWEKLFHRLFFGYFTCTGVLNLVCDDMLSGCYV